MSKLLIIRGGKKCKTFEMAVGEDCESYKCQKRAGTEKNASQSGFEMAVGDSFECQNC